LNHLSSSKGIFFFLVGPAGSGKSTLCEYITSMYQDSVQRIITATTRPKREGEIDNISYYFLTREKFDEKIKANEFFEWEINHGNLYGTFRNSLEEAINSKKDLVFTIDIKGALNFKKYYQERAVLIFISSPDPALLEKRLKERGTAEQDLKIRLESARFEYQLFQQKQKEFDYILLNEELEMSKAVLKSIITVERIKISRYTAKEIQKISSL
jgi:guanylate kinase